MAHDPASEPNDFFAELVREHAVIETPATIPVDVITATLHRTARPDTAIADAADASAVAAAVAEAADIRAEALRADAAGERSPA